MADWKRTLEPYIKVQEIVKTTSLNPTAGESLIVAVAIISDAGPCTPTLINGQKEFRQTFASEDITEEYVKSLDKLYLGDNSSLASQMWSNAYRLAGSTSLLVVRAGAAGGAFLSKPLVSQKNNIDTYILKDGELLKKVSGFKISINSDLDASTIDDDGWAISINNVGIFGNRTTDDGAQYDYMVNNLPDLVSSLNETSMFYCPDVKFEDKDHNEVKITVDSSFADKSSVAYALFNEVYCGSNLLDKEDERTEYSYESTAGDEVKANIGFVNLTVAEIDSSAGNLNQKGATSNGDEDKSFDLNSTAYSGFEATKFYATNIFNSATDLKVRIRRFNHDAVVDKTIAETSNLTASGASPYTVLTSVLDTFTEGGTKEPSSENSKRDFFEIAVQDPKAGDNVLYFNVGNIAGRGDMSIDEVNASLSMINLVLPDDLHDLGLDYFDYSKDDFEAIEIEKPLNWDAQVNIINSTDASVTEEQKAAATRTKNAIATTVTALVDLSDKLKLRYKGKAFYVVAEDKFYQIQEKTADSQIFVDVTVKPEETKLISVSDSNLQEAFDLISEHETYVVEGLCDLGDTNLAFQSYLCNMAINENYFYPISTVNSTNYLTIANSAKKLSQDSYKLYMSSPWDIDSSTLGWKFFACPSVLYWEMVSKNRRNDEEFRPCFGQNSIAYQSPVCEFNKKTRELLLSKKVNTVKWDTQTQSWNMNDNYTKQVENTIMNDEANSRLAVRISKNVPTLLRQFIGKKISERLCKAMYDTIDTWFKNDILPMSYTVEDYKIKCEYDAVLARKNKVKVVIAVRFSRALKYIDVLDYYFDTGVELSVEE